VKEHPQLVKLIDCNEIKQSPQLFLGMEMN